MAVAGGEADMAADVERLVERFDHRDPAFAQPDAPYEVFRALRARCPVAHSDAHGGFWVASTYDAVTSVARDDATYRSSWGISVPGTTVPPELRERGVLPPPPPSQYMITMMDPPTSLRYRRLLNPFFAPMAAKRREPAIRALVTELIDRFIDRGRADLQAELAKPLTGMFTMQLVGLPVEDWRLYAEPVHKSIHEGTGYGTDQALDDRVATILSVAEQRRARPADDLLSHLTTVRLDGRPLEPDEIVGITFLTIIGGVETTTSLSSNAFIHLGRDRMLRQRLIDQPSLIPRAVEEFLRYYTPVQTNSRLVATATELEGQPLEPGDVVLMCWASANRDEREFPDADRFVLDRPANRHVAFAVGTHRCLGSHFARAELRIVFEELLRRIPDYNLDETGLRLYADVGDVYGYNAVPVTFPTPGRR